MPWGVAVATTDQPHHFNVDPADGVSTSEPIRAIAAMAALAVKALGASEPAPCLIAPMTARESQTAKGDGEIRSGNKEVPKIEQDQETKIREEH
jgi:hypothetical protein